jgi:hypothetical protein
MSDLNRVIHGAMSQADFNAKWKKKDPKKEASKKLTGTTIYQNLVHTREGAMPSFKDFLKELSPGTLSKYIHHASDQVATDTRTQSSKNWDKTIKRADKITLAKLKIRDRAVKVPAKKKKFSVTGIAVKND